MEHRASNFSSQACSEEVDIAGQCDERTLTEIDGAPQGKRAQEFFIHGRQEDSQLNFTQHAIQSTRTPATFDADNDDVAAFHDQCRLVTPNANRSERLPPLFKGQQCIDLLFIQRLPRIHRLQSRTWIFTRCTAAAILRKGSVRQKHRTAVVKTRKTVRQ